MTWSPSTVSLAGKAAGRIGASVEPDGSLAGGDCGARVSPLDNTVIWHRVPRAMRGATPVTIGNRGMASLRPTIKTTPLEKH